MLNQLPIEILEEVLLKLPIKLLIRCTSVLKNLNELIKSTEFISKYLAKAISGINGDPRLLRMLLNEEDGSYAVSLRSIRSDQLFYRQLDIPQTLTPRPALWMIGYSNGVFCFANGEISHPYSNYILWNPCLHKSFLLPESNYKHHVAAAIEYDSIVNDYKVFAARSYYSEALGKYNMEVEVYSLNTNSWHVVQVNDPDFRFCQSHRTSVGGRMYFYSNHYVSVKGMIYFCGEEYVGEKEDSVKCVLAFNLAEEVFHKIRAPDLGYAYIWYPIYHGESIAVVGDDINMVELWIMDEVSGWKMVFGTEVEPGGGGVEFYGVWEGHQVLWKKENGAVDSYDLNTSELKIVDILAREEGHTYSCICHYVESPALLDKGMYIQ